MSGEEIKDFFKKEGISQASVAKKLGKSTQAFADNLKAKEIKFSLLQQIADAVGRDVNYILDKAGSASATGGSVAVAGDNNSVVTISERFIALLEKKDEQIDKKDEQIDKLLDIISKK